MESIAGWPMVFHHTMKVDTAVLPDRPESVQVQVLRNSSFSFVVDLGIVVAFAVLVGWIMRRILRRYRARGRAWCGLVLILVVIGGYALVLLLVYVEYDTHITQQGELKEQFDYRTARLDRRCRYFGQHLVYRTLATFGYGEEPRQIATLALQQEHQERLHEVLECTDLRSLKLSNVAVGSSELTRMAHHRRLVTLELIDCEMKGDLCATLTQLPALTFLRIENCRFHGPSELRISKLLHVRALSLVSELEPGRLEPITVDSLPELELLGVHGFAMDLAASNLPNLAVLNCQEANAKKLQDLSTRPLSSRIRIEEARKLAAIEIDATLVDSIVMQGLSSLPHMKLLGAGSHPGPRPPEDARDVSLTANDVNCERVTATGLAVDAAFLDSLQKMQPSAVDLLGCDIAPEILLKTTPWQKLRQLSMTGPKFDGDELCNLIAQFPDLTSLIAGCADEPLRLRFPRGRNLASLGLVGVPRIESLGNATDLPDRIAVARHVSELSDRDSILRYTVSPPGSLRTFRMRSGQISRAELDRLIDHPDGAYSFDLHGMAMTVEEWRGMDWGMARGLAVRGNLPGSVDGQIVTSWKPLKNCVALRLYDLTIRSNHVNSLLSEHKNWRALDFGRTFISVRDLKILATFPSLEYLSLFRRHVDAADLQWLTQLPALRRLDVAFWPLPDDVADGLVARKELLEIAVNPHSSFWGRIKSRNEVVPNIRFVKEFSEATACRPAINRP